jgi:hypothetical protein
MYRYNTLVQLLCCFIIIGSCAQMKASEYNQKEKSKINFEPFLKKYTDPRYTVKKTDSSILIMLQNNILFGYFAKKSNFVSSVMIDQPREELPNEGCSDIVATFTRERFDDLVQLINMIASDYSKQEKAA